MSRKPRPGSPAAPGRAARPTGSRAPGDDDVLVGEVVSDLEANSRGADDARDAFDERDATDPGRGPSADRGDDLEAGPGGAVEEGDALEDVDVIEGEVVDLDAADLDAADLDAADLDATDLARAPLPARASDAAGLAPLDPLQAYMRDVQRYSLLTPEETHELAVKYAETGDVEAARKLVTSNLRLVVKIAYDYRRAYRNILDLIQEGNIGLMQAVKKYDPYKGVKLSSYAAWWIRAYILRFILNNWRLVKLGTTQAQRKLFFNLKKEKAKLAAMGIDPTPETIAARLDVPVDEVIHMDRRLSAGEASLDAPVGQSDGSRPASRLELLPGGDRPIDEALASEQLQELLTDKIREFGATLKGKEEIIFRERLMSDEPKTLQELGEQFGVSRERVRQIEKRLQGKIRQYLEKHVEGSALG